MKSEPKTIDVKPGELCITWADGHDSRFPMAYLRAQCPCASCVHELTGERLLNLGNIPENLFCTKAEQMGHYALSLAFSDGHATGIYTYEALRGMCPCGECVSMA